MIVLLLSLPVMAEDVSDTRRVVLTNCDTGRCVYTEQYNQFVCHDYGNGSCSFTNERSSAFLDFTEEGMEYSYSEVRYTLIDTGFSRYQIMTEDGRFVIDTDEGETNEASVGLADGGSKAVNTAWYITENADDVIKVMPLGDSLTWGSNPDVMGPNLSYRCELSGFLVDYFGDVVFTGNETTEGFYCDTKALMRHSGYCGYVIEDVYHVSDHPGLSEMTTPMIEKYAPDIVIMMLGTNDCAMVSGSSEINALMDRWEGFVRNIEEKLPENGK